MAKINYEEYVADFETTVYDGQDKTEVWATALIRLDDETEPENVIVDNKLSDFMNRVMKKLYSRHVKLYFHNEKFDASFIMNYILRKPEMFQPWGSYNNDMWNFPDYNSLTQLPENNYIYSISNKGQWYHITLKRHGHILQIVDSLKLLPFSVEKISKDFDTKYKKLEMEYVGERKPGGKIKPEEEEYIKHDVLPIKEVLNFMKDQGHTGMTIGACCLKEFKSFYSKSGWDLFFPNLYEIPTEAEGYKSEGDFIRASYKGGWCYVIPEKSGKVFRKGTTADVNSLYPSMMHSSSGNRFPVGKGTYFKGEIPEEAKADDKYYFVRIKTRFHLKKNHLPCIQIKDNVLYHPRKWLESSDYIDKNGNAWSYVDNFGEKLECRPELVLTMTDYELIKNQYNITDCEIIDGYYYDAITGIFDEYINKYASIKVHSTGAMRMLAKLFLNNLYGKFATSTDSSYKVCYLNKDGALRMYDVQKNDKVPGYIPIGSAITSYARNFTITASQKNYKYFIYADTDSMHLSCGPDEIKGAPEHPTEFNHWKYESQWDFGKFIRAKTYVEHVIGENREEVKPYYNVKCAGMTEHCKDLLIKSITQDYTKEDIKKLDDDEIEFIKEKRTWDDFKIGLEIPGMLKAENIKGGVLLVKGNYKMREHI